MRKSLFRKYFTIFTVTSICSILILGIILMLFASRYFQAEKYELLERNAQRAAIVTANNYMDNENRSVDRPLLMVAYSVLASAIDAEIFLTDLGGGVLLGAGAPEASREGLVITQEIIRQAVQGTYRNTTMMDGVFSSPRYVVGVPVYAGDKAIGVLFAASSTYMFDAFTRNLASMFILSAAFVLLVSVIVAYAVTSRMVRPLKDMLAATQSFSQGDFSRRVPVSGYDEVGQLAMAFNNMANTLATTEQTRRLFIANVSHELKTPMTTISGFVDGILDGTIPAEKHNQYLQVVATEVKRLSRLVRSMLDTARIEAGELGVNPVTFDISEIIRQTIFSFEQSVEEKRLEMRGLDTDKIMVTADIDLIHQVIYNLVENAVKFVNEDGYIEFRYQCDGERTYVCIRNSGEGFEPEEARQLFERFYKSDRSRTNKSGVGLGLHIVKTIIKYHNGEIEARSEKDRYTEFEFWIPNTRDAMPCKEKISPKK